VLDTGFSLPVTILCGKEEGSTILITAGIHGEEYCGVEAAMELAHELKPEDITGILCIIPVCNSPAFFHHIPENLEQEDLNRCFPGNAEGSLLDRLAYVLFQNWILSSDFYIDLHGGGKEEVLFPHLYYQGAAKTSTKRASLAMSQAVGLPYRIRIDDNSYGAFNCAGAAGVPAVLLARGGKGTWTPEEVEAYKNDLRTLLVHLEVLSAEPPPSITPPTELTALNCETALCDGLWYPEMQPGDCFSCGDVFGTIRDFSGEILTTVAALCDGVLLYQVDALAVQSGSPLLTYGAL
jgi:predicted deacylase